MRLSKLICAVAIALSACATPRASLLSSSVTPPTSEGGFVWFAEHGAWSNGEAVTHVYLCRAAGQPPCIKIGAVEASGEALRDWINRASRTE